MRRNLSLLLLFLLLSPLYRQPLHAQDTAVTEKEQLTRDMYRQFADNDYEALKTTVARLKELSLMTGDEKLFYKAWGNQILRGIYPEGREAALRQSQELMDYATRHDSKFGLYSAHFVFGYVLSQLKDTRGGIEHMMIALDLLSKYSPEESKASLRNKLAELFFSIRDYRESIRYARQTVDDPQTSKPFRVQALQNICYALGEQRDREQFNKVYADLTALQPVPQKLNDGWRKVELYRASLNNRHAEALVHARSLKSKVSRLLFTYKEYDWSGDYQHALNAYILYKIYIDSLNTQEVRNSASRYHEELNAAQAENEAKELRLKNQQLLLERARHDLEQQRHEADRQRLEAEAAKLKIENADMELAAAAAKLRSDSLDRKVNLSRLSELKSRMDYQQQTEHNHHIIIFSTAVIALLSLLYLLLYLHRRQRAAKRLEAAHTQLQSAYERLEETTTQKERIESELRIARDIQMGMVPQTFPRRSDVDLYASMTPAKEVGGDLYDFFIQSDRVYFCVGDVSGKGVPASMLMSVAVNLFRTFAKEGFPPAYIATKLNDTLSADNANGMFITMFIGELNLQSGRLDFCNAGHNPPLLNGRYIDMESNAPIGLWPGLEFVGQQLDGIKGKTFFVYTDGLTEAENEAQEQYGEETLASLLLHGAHGSAQDTVEMIQRSVAHYVGNAEASDDLTMMCIKVPS